MKFGERPEFAPNIRRAGKALQVSLETLGIEQFLAEREEQVLVMLACYLFYDVPMRGTASLATLLLQREGKNWPARERAYLAQMAAQPISVYDVLDVFPGQGIELRDVLRGFVVRVHEVLASKAVVPGWLVLTRVRLRPDVGPVLDAPPVQFEADGRETLLEMLRSTEGQPLVTRSIEAFRAWQEYMANGFGSRRSSAENSARDQFGSHVLQFEVDDEVEFAAALAECEGWEQSDGGWMWIDARDDAIDLEDFRFAILDIRDGEGILVVDSESTIERMEELLDTLPGVDVVGSIAIEPSPWIRRVRKVIEERARVMKLSASLPEPLSSAMEETVISRELDRYYRAWVDERIPAFGGRTPREMAKVDPEAVSRMLWTLENPKDPKVKFEMGWMYRELGVRRLGSGSFEAGVEGAQGS